MLTAAPALGSSPAQTRVGGHTQTAPKQQIWPGFPPRGEEGMTWDNDVESYSKKLP